MVIDAPTSSKLAKQLSEQEELELELKKQIGAQKARQAMDAFAERNEGTMEILGKDSTLGANTIVWYSLDGGEMSCSNQETVATGTKLGILPIPTKPGYIFAGWWTNLGPDGIELTSNTMTISSDPLVLYAKWKVNPNSVAVNTSTLGMTYQIGTSNSLSTKQKPAVSTVNTRNYAVGEIGPSGGYVFYDKSYYSDGWRYLEAAPAGWSGANEDPWMLFGYHRTSSSGKNLLVRTETELGTGNYNTSALISAMGTKTYNDRQGTAKVNYTAKVCADYAIGGNGDWFLPSKDELILMYNNLKKQGLGGFSGFYYWSSSEYDSDYAWGKNFLNGYQNVFRRDGEFRLRPVRGF